MKEKKKAKKSSKHRFKKFLIGFLILFLLVCAAGAGVVIAVINAAPAIDINILNNLKQSSKIYDRNGNYITDLSETENRKVVPLKSIPDNLKNAFIAIEDERFYKHHGIDVKRIMGALFVDLRTMSKAQGASTITQQLIKNYALTDEKKITRKLTEAYLAIELERKLSKEQILEAYLNTIYLGKNAYGVEAASNLYFNKNVENNNLTLGECALIAGLTKNPAKYYPFSKKNRENPKNYLERQRTVLKKMLDLGFITQSQYDQAYNQKLVFKSNDSKLGTKYQWFIEPAIDQAASDFANLYSIDIKEAKQKLRTGGYNIYLTIDKDIQDKAEEVINNANNYPYLPKSKRYYPSDSKNSNTKGLIQPQAAAVVMDPTNGEVRAIVGGRGEHPLLSYNRATDTEVARQPGSSIKPLAVYGPAVDKGKITPITKIKDTTISVGGWTVVGKNASGSVTLRTGIKKSLNPVAVRVEMQIGTDTSVDYLENKFHISTLVLDGAVNDKNAAALALGGMTHGVTPLDMAAAYSVYANSGIYSKPIFYTKITDRNDNDVLDRKPDQSQSISAATAYVMTDLLKSVVKDGTGTRASLGNMPAAGKTGTTNDATNLWFCGYTPYYTCTVWIGHDKKTVPLGNGESSAGRWAAPIWKQIMETANKDLPVKDFTKPKGVVTEQLCKYTGKVASDGCKGHTYTEVFIDGTQPAALCNVHGGSSTKKDNYTTNPTTAPDNSDETDTFTTDSTDTNNNAKQNKSKDDAVTPNNENEIGPNQ